MSSAPEVPVEKNQKKVGVATPWGDSSPAVSRGFRGTTVKLNIWK